MHRIIVLQPIPGGARIDVSINELYDGSYTGSPHDLIAAQGRGAGAPIGPISALPLTPAGSSTGPSSGPRAGPTRRTSLTHVLVWRPRAKRRQHKHSLAEFLELDDAELLEAQRPYITGHNRYLTLAKFRYSLFHFVWAMKIRVNVLLPDCTTTRSPACPCTQMN